MTVYAHLTEDSHGFHSHGTLQLIQKLRDRHISQEVLATKFIPLVSSGSVTMDCLECKPSTVSVAPLKVGNPAGCFRWTVPSTHTFINFNKLPTRQHPCSEGTCFQKTNILNVCQGQVKRCEFASLRVSCTAYAEETDHNKFVKIHSYLPSDSQTMLIKNPPIGNAFLEILVFHGL